MNYRIVRVNAVTGKVLGEEQTIPRSERELKEGDILVNPLPTLRGWFRVLGEVRREKAC